MRPHLLTTGLAAVIEHAQHAWCVSQLFLSHDNRRALLLALYCRLLFLLLLLLLLLLPAAMCRLAASADVVGVTIGSIVGHAACTAAAVIGGRHLAAHIDEHTVQVSGDSTPGVWFLELEEHAVTLSDSCIQRGWLQSHTPGLLAGWLLTDLALLLLRLLYVACISKRGCKRVQQACPRISVTHTAPKQLAC
jgi:hypothetical protein